MSKAASIHASLREWMFGAALPFWAEFGVDAPETGFRESLALDGSPFGAPFKRVRVQARQVYVFCQAERMGWAGGLDVARRGYDFLLGHGRLPGGGWAKLLAAKGGVLDSNADLYDLAFVVLALAWFARVSGEVEPLRLAHETVEWVWIALAAPEGGFENALPPDAGPRQQNPHMHLFEALLALQETAPSMVTEQRVGTLLQLFRHYFFDPQSGTLGEFFDRGLRPAPGTAGQVVEPGHQYEWVWLLHEYSRLFGTELAGEANRLYAFANLHGPLPSGLLLNAVDRQGRPLDRGSRLWPITEAIRAHIVMGERRGGLDEVRIGQCADVLQRHFLSWTPRGTWIDTRDAEGRDAIGRVPASSLYHIMGAFAELDRVVRQPGF